MVDVDENFAASWYRGGRNWPSHAWPSSSGWGYVVVAARTRVLKRFVEHTYECENMITSTMKKKTLLFLPAIQV